MLIDPVRIIFTATPGSIMVRWPDGRVEFFDGYWGMVRLVWHIVSTGASYVIEDHRHG